MGMNQTPAAERVHIVFLGRRNAGKSSVMNAVTGQDLAVVSPVRGTTTDPVSKTMELLPLGPVVLVDTPGIDDEGELGALRVRKSRQQLNRADIAVLVVDGTEGMREEDESLLRLIRKKGLPHLVVFNKADLTSGAESGSIDQEADTGTAGEKCEQNQESEAGRTGKEQPAGEKCERPKESEVGSAGMEQPLPFRGSKVGSDEHQAGVIWVSARTGRGIHALKEALGRLGREAEEERSLLDGIVKSGDTVVLVVPIDKAAPKGRLILPQQMTVRALLDLGAAAVVTRETELEELLGRLSFPPSLVITDSQVFSKVAGIIPERCPLTSFSILMARYKGDLRQNVEGVRALRSLKDGDRILVAEGCTHHRQCGDIGTAKLPAWVGRYTGKRLTYTTCSGTEFPEELGAYQLIVHCGGCMLTSREMRYRLACAADQGVPMTNYGTVIAETCGILERSLQPIPGF